MSKKKKRRAAKAPSTLEDLKPADYNPREIEPEAMEGLRQSLRIFGDLSGFVFNAKTGHLVCAHQRKEAAKDLNPKAIKWGKPYKVQLGHDGKRFRSTERSGFFMTGDGVRFNVRQVSWPLIFEKAANVAANSEAISGEFTPDLQLVLMEIQEADANIFDALLLSELVEDVAEDKQPKDTGTIEVVTDPITRPGDLWRFGDHRLLCGDSTIPSDVAKLFGKDKATLLHADPPYGMGKEAEGIANDNLYNGKLDSFQMSWWEAWRGHLVDNASAYIWGNAPDLWRLWYTGGLGDLQELTVQSEIVWDKGDGGTNVGTEAGRRYHTSERCLFLMLGEQGYDTNAHNFYEGWEPIRSYLRKQRNEMGWNNPTVAYFFGLHARMADHWFSKSQWTFIQEDQYKRLQKEAKGRAFRKTYKALQKQFHMAKTEFDSIKQGFYEARAQFDNQHDNMIDLWRFSRVLGEDRLGHATPKPVDMMERAIKTSSEEGDVVAVPFGGTGPEFIAADYLGRKCYGMELSPEYCDTILRRWIDISDGNPVRQDRKSFRKLSKV